MGIADQLFQIVQEIAIGYQRRAAHIEREILDLEAQLKEKKAALHTARMAIERAGNFRPMLGANFHCPACWIEKEQTAILRPVPGDGMTCNECDRTFAV